MWCGELRASLVRSCRRASTQLRELKVVFACDCVARNDDLLTYPFRYFVFGGTLQNSTTEFCVQACAMFAVVLLMHVVRGVHLLIADSGNRRLQLCDEATPGGACHTAVSGLESAPGLMSPVSVTVDNAGDYIVATGHQIKRCRAVSPDAGCEVAVGWEDSGDGGTELCNPKGLF